MKERGTFRHDEIRSRSWRLTGIAKVLRGVEVDEARLDGTVVVGGPLVAREASVRGSLEARGPVTVAGRLRAQGSVEARATVRAGEATLDGPARIEGELAVDTGLEVRGRLRAPAVRCATLRVRGGLDIPGTVTATSVDLELDSDSTVAVVLCQHLTLRGPSPSVVPRVLGREAVVTVDRVEAETARVEAARVGFLKAREITLGRDAHVREVEGRVVRAHRSSRLGPESWSPPPVGLSR